MHRTSILDDMQLSIELVTYKNYNNHLDIAMSLIFPFILFLKNCVIR
jgi:hypothetical protein